jgi:hypothetical protein
MHPNFWLENKEGTTQKVLYVDRRTILKIKVDLREVGWEDTNWTCLVQD